MKKSHYVLGACAIIMAIVVGLFLLLDKPDNTMAGRIYPATFQDLIGTRIASTTTGVAWYGAYVAYSTYPIPLLGAENASIIIYPLAASSTSMSDIHLVFLGSNDPGCNTATTSTILNILTKSEVRWFDASSYIASASAFSAFSNATTTFGWVDPALIQREIHFEGLHIECLAVEITASSTILYANYRLTKD